MCGLKTPVSSGLLMNKPAVRSDTAALRVSSSTYPFGPTGTSMILKPAAEAAAGFVGWVASVEIISSRSWSPRLAWYAFMIRTLAKMA